jgi:hypothetical protein
MWSRPVSGSSATPALGDPTIPIGQAAQAVNYVPNAVPEGDGTRGLQALGVAGAVAHLVLGTAGGCGDAG